MKKLLSSLLILFFIINVSADITDLQGEKVSSFAKNFIVKGMSREHIDNKGMPILSYRQGLARIYGYQEILTFIENDSINIDAVDNESGLNNNPYSYDNCKTWTFKNKKAIAENG